MCSTCGCSAGPEHGHTHDHAHEGHHHDHSHPEEEPVKRRQIAVEQDILTRNNTQAASNRAAFAARHVLALNLVSSPGAGKTTLLVETLKRLGQPAAVIEGDQETSADAVRIRETGYPAFQVNTGRGCHLDAAMVSHACEHLGAIENAFLFIENVGNLVCPAAFDLGEAQRVVIVSVTEGEDKPLKYPHIFASADLMIISKTDLLPYLDCDVEVLSDNARRVNPRIAIVALSVRSGNGMDKWLNWLKAIQVLRNAAS